MRRKGDTLLAMAAEIKRDLPKMNWKSVPAGTYTYFVIDGAPLNVFFIKHSIRRMFRMQKGKWIEVGVDVLLNELQLEFEDLWRNNKLDLNEYIEIKEEEKKEVEHPVFSEEDE